MRLLAEPFEREQKRKELIQMKKSLLQGQQILNELQQKTYNAGADSEASTNSTIVGADFSASGMPADVPEETEDMCIDTEI